MSAAGGRFLSLDEAPRLELAAGARARALFGERAMINVVELEPGATVTPHAHPHEQLGLMLRGSMSMTIGGVEREIGADDAFIIPGGVEHGGTAGPQGAVMVDVFAPVREDYRAAARTD